MSPWRAGILPLLQLSAHVYQCYPGDLKVPSIITGEPNYILDPNHPDFAKIDVKDLRIFHFDERLFP
jgi:hypothetical protein